MRQGAGASVRVVAGVVLCDARLLVARRRPTGPSDGEAGRWELPGGKVRPGETDEQALERELREELALGTRTLYRIGPTVTVRPGVELRCYRSERIDDSGIVLLDHDEYRWVEAAELGAVDLLPADRQLVEWLRAELRRSAAP